MDGRAVASIVTAAFLWLCGGLALASSPDAFVRLPAAGDGRGPLVLLLSGDGDWAPFPRAFGEAAARAGSPVLGLKTRTYLDRRTRTPEQIAADLEGPVRADLAASGRDALVIVGYSRGADWTAFIVNRWPEDLRERVRAIAFVGLSEHANFAFHFDDLFRDVARPSDVPTQPEVEKLAGIPMICAYGEDEEDTLCAHPVSGMRVLKHTGAHRVKDDTDLIGSLLHELGIDSGESGSSSSAGPAPSSRAEPRPTSPEEPAPALSSPKPDAAPPSRREPRP